MTPRIEIPTTRHAVLLRGINVGGKNKLPMKSLVALFEAAGAENVRTYIQSGNVLFDAPPDSASRIAERIRDGIEADFGYSIPVVLRTAAELAAIVERNPFLPTDGSEPDPKTLHVAFLASEPTAEQIATLEPDRSPGDSFRVLGREIYLHCPNGLARTKLTNAWFDSRLGTTSTVRNWKTTRKLLELAEGA